MGTPGIDFLLVVEDQRDIREVFVLVLRGEGYRVQCARDGVEALEKAARGPGRPALILLDLSMPRMDGLEFCRRKLTIPALADVPVVIISAVSDFAAEHGPLPAACGVKAMLSKPIGLEKLLGCAATWGSAARTFRGHDQPEP